jgi:predicted nucleic acid-binding protein
VILADTSVWVDHLRGADTQLASRLDAGQVLGHPFVAAELALGNLKARDLILSSLQALPQAMVASASELMAFIDAHRLAGRGIGLVDAHLLAATALTPDARLWTRDSRLDAAARALGLAA